MKKTLTSLSCALLLSGVAASATASDWKLSGNVALTSNYVFRGFTQTTEDPAIQGGFDLNHTSGFFAGVWASNVDETIGGGANIELDGYLGWTGDLTGDGLELTLQALYYGYPGHNAGTDFETTEVSAYLAKDFGAAAVNAGVNYSDDYFGGDEVVYWDLNLDIPAGPVTVGLHAGATEYDNAAGDDYTDYGISFSGSAGGVDLSLAFTQTDGHAANEDNVSFTVSKEF